MRRKATLALGAAALALPILPLFAMGTAYGHGYTDYPPSRSSRCAAGEVKDCGPIQWEPQSVEGPKGFPGSGPADGTICAGGNEQFAQLDDPRGGNWPAKAVTGGQSATFSWTITAQHSTTSFRYFITKDGYDPAKPLSRDDLEPEPFFAKEYSGGKPGQTETHEVKVPSGKSGKHLILGVWDIADTGNAFYSCADVTFGGGDGGDDGADDGPGGDNPDDPECGAEATTRD